MSSEIASTAGPGDDAAEATLPDTEIDDSLIPIFTSIDIQDDQGSEDYDEDAAGEVGEHNASLSMPVIKRKNRSKGIMARGPTALPKNRGNGFEEYFADPPMTPEEAMQEKQEMYHPDISFEKRMQSCIQRYRSRRRLQHHRTLYFDEYLFLGGVDTSQGAYTGLDPKELKQLTPAQRKEATARHVVHEGSSAGDRFYDGDETKWTVDFSGVVAGFFSTTIIPLTGLQRGPLEDAIDVIENFLRYILHHDVCPEHEGDVNGAMKVCQAAREEWPMLNALQTTLPGLFNLAATELFSKPDPDAWAFHLFKVHHGFEAKPIFYSTIALIEDPKAFEYLTQRPATLFRQYECTLEITMVTLPNEETIQRFKSLKVETHGGTNKLRLAPIGKVTLKPATIEDGWVRPDTPHPLEGEEIDLYFEQDVLVNLKPGMKMTLEIGELGGGVNFVRRIRKIVPSFYTFLPQELMRGFKPPRENDRPAPSIHNPTAEDSQAADEQV
ncbi:Argonaute siRNA chaperone complex subunit Arb1-domain-containing protein [Trichoderma asperelloides]|nr:Argonaute siRNA chaperone complex subunit Arb1-domain-containing protein [Trichoderma asperelloides]